MDKFTELDRDLARRFFMSMGMDLSPCHIIEDGVSIELGGKFCGGHYTVTNDGIVERINHSFTHEDGHIQTESKVGECNSLPKALTAILHDIVEGMAFTFFESGAEKVYDFDAASENANRQT